MIFKFLYYKPEIYTHFRIPTKTCATRYNIVCKCAFFLVVNEEKFPSLTLILTLKMTSFTGVTTTNAANK